MKYKFALIGLGEISKHYSSLLALSNIDLIAVIDKNEKAPGRELFKDVDFYSDYSSIIDIKPDFVIVAATANVHFRIISDVLSYGINVISEKPLAENLKEVEKLYKIAKKNNVALLPIYHWQYTDEAIWIKQNLKRLGKLKSAEMIIHDPYAFETGDSIKSDRVGMLGALLDEFPNAISLLDEIINFDDKNKVDIIYSRIIVDENCNYAIYSESKLLYDNIEMKIRIDWRKNVSDKHFIFDFENSTVDILHSEKRIYEEDKLVFEWNADDYKTEQYKRLFGDFIPEKTNYRLTKFLFKLMESIKANYIHTTK